MSNMYAVGEQVEFHYMFNDEDEWVPSIITKAERKSNADGQIVPHYDLELETHEYDITGALDDNLRIPAFYEAGTAVLFYDKKTSDWVKATVKEIKFQAASSDDQRQMPSYVITSNQQDRIQAQPSELRMLQLYKQNDRVEFCEHDTGEENWVEAIVRSDATHVAISESNLHQIQVYDLQLNTNLKGGNLIKKGVDFDSIRPLAITAAEPDLREENNTATPEPAPEPQPAPEPTTVGASDDKNHHMDTIDEDQNQTEEVSENNFDSQPPQEIIETAPLEFDALTTNTKLIPSPRQLSFPEHDVFAEGDRVEVLRGKIFTSGNIVSVTPYSANKLYSVRYDAQTTENNLEEANIQRLFDHIGTRVYIRDPNNTDKWIWGIVLGKKNRRRDAKIAVGHTCYDVLTRHKGGLTVTRSETRNMRPFTHNFTNFDVVELQQINRGVVSWQLGTVYEMNPEGTTYTVRTNKAFATVMATQMRPSFVVGNFVRVLHHRITDVHFSGQSSWVEGVVMSIDVVSGMHGEDTCSYLYNVLLLDRRVGGRDRMPDVLTVKAVIDLLASASFVTTIFSQPLIYMLALI